MCDNLLEEFFEPTKEQSQEIPKQKHKTPNPPATTEHQTIKSRTTGNDVEISFGPQPGNLVPANPFASKAQQGYMHAHPEILGSKKLAEFDRASKGLKLPKRKS